MLGTLKILNHSFKTFLDNGDPRVANWPMMQSPFPGIAMIAAYIYFVKVAGPQFMKKRKAFELRGLMAVYNFLMVFVNLVVFLGIGHYGYFNGYSLKCQPVDYSYKHDALRMAQMGYLFYLTKFVEFADTIFFVLRKKHNQISALHVIHHSIVPFSLWFGIKFAPGGYNAFFPFLNSFIHVIMYTYYGLAAMGEKYQKYLFWKKYMTYMQLMQFVAVILYAISLHVNSCDISTTFILMNFIHALLFFGLFLNFFVQSYVRRSNTRKKSPSLVSNDRPEPCLRNHVEDTKMEEATPNYRMQVHKCSDQDCNLNCRFPLPNDLVSNGKKEMLNGSCEGEKHLKYQ
ncbi:hypothetical protein JTE90_005971 [Oedothorax gibbosus]|uniref:Elongation of very long chain fatty acids protein n=1 Tax=Oedothorax gibbosus TaxID=931172 RepID=A0AAV6UWC0_9ARAC|nr:hypothetical protein JTE90_005971 [Oedothorax gibbosus]